MPSSKLSHFILVAFVLSASSFSSLAFFTRNGVRVTMWCLYMGAARTGKRVMLQRLLSKGANKMPKSAPRESFLTPVISEPYPSDSVQHYERATRLWVERFVYGHGMCPWSGASLIGDRMRIRTIFGGHDAKSTLQLADEIFNECKRFETDGKNGTATTLLIFPEQTEFDDFLDIVSIAEGILEENDMVELLQVAHFHPEYMFQGSKNDSIENYTNRSPFPTLHLIQVAEVTKAIESCKDGDTSFVWKKNIDTVRKLGKSKIKDLLKKIAEDSNKSSPLEK